MARVDGREAVDAVEAALGQVAAFASTHRPPAGSLSSLAREVGIVDLPCLAGIDANVPSYAEMSRDICDGIRESHVLSTFVSAAVEEGHLASALASLDHRRAREVLDALLYATYLSAVTERVVSSADVTTTRQLRDSVKALEVSKGNWRSELSFFELVKLHTMDMSVAQMAAAREQGMVRPTFGHIGIPVNIAEALAVDVARGSLDNAAAALSLIDGRPIGDDRAFHCAAGRCEWLTRQARIDERDPRGVVQVWPALASKWVDLYISWNMAFCSEYEDALHFFAKLLAPAVLRAEPQEFIVRRSIALYLHIWHTIVNRGNKSVTTRRMDFRSKALTRLWSRVNREAAAEYTAAITSARRASVPLEGRRRQDGGHRAVRVVLIGSLKARRLLSAPFKSAAL